MRPIGEIARGWAALSKEQRAERIERARVLWATNDAGTPSWDSLSELQREAAARLLPMVEQDRQDQPRFKCPRCLDRGYLTHETMDRWHRSEANPEGVGSAVWFCTCDGGESAEAGYWFNALYPQEPSGRRHKSDAGQARFLEYVRAKPIRAFAMEARVEALKQKYERERSRKLEAVRQHEDET